MAERKSAKGGSKATRPAGSSRSGSKASRSSASSGARSKTSRPASAGGGSKTSRQAASAGGGSQPKASAGGGSESNGRGGMTALEAAGAARESLAALLGRPVEAVLGIDRDGRSWVVKAQVLELARVPNTTDVLGEYEAVLDGRGEVVRYSRTGRYHRGQVDSER